MVWENVYTKFQLRIVFFFWSGGVTQIDTQIYEWIKELTLPVSRPKPILIGQSRRYVKNPRDALVFDARRPRGHSFEKRKKQDNPGDMRQFLEANDRQGLFFEKTKHSFIDMLLGSVCTKFQVCIFFCCGLKAPYRQTDPLNYKRR